MLTLVNIVGVKIKLCLFVGKFGQLFHVLEDYFVYGIFGELRKYSERGNYCCLFNFVCMFVNLCIFQYILLFVINLHTVFIKNTHFCFLLYLLRK